MDTCSACGNKTNAYSWYEEHILCAFCQQIARDMGLDLNERISPANLQVIAAMQADYESDGYRIAC